MGAGHFVDCNGSFAPNCSRSEGGESHLRAAVAEMKALVP